ncbi:Protein ALP1-like [Frankliniella fusca]|uniref:Protein ALP1-like n=1 Tax=Frankliniella fusca TaxID=407009 RepID=A0AAE1HHI9_9NEOP|nr:Protein ALP1-like [Frankliniella fusca]
MKKDDHEKFYETFRMTPKCFDWLLNLVQPFLEKRSFRKPVCPGERLAITLKFLASGDSYLTLEKYFLVSEPTISLVVSETSAVLWSCLKPIVFKKSSIDTWLECASEFESMWDFPHCLGAIDGKHVTVHSPPLSGSRFFNYKKFFSFILLGVCDAKMKFLMVDVGSSGSRGDGNVFHRSKFAKKLKKHQLDLPPPCKLYGSSENVPFFFVGDAAFERGSHILTPFKGKFLSPEKRLFNYRLSRSRRQIENAFGALYKRYGIFQKPLQTSLAHAKSIVLSACALHNLHLMDEESSTPCRTRRYRCNKHGKYHDDLKADGTIVYGRFKGEDPAKEEEILHRLEEDVTTSNPEDTTLVGTKVTEFFVDFFIDNEIPWQWKSAGIPTCEVSHL